MDLRFRNVIVSVLTLIYFFNSSVTCFDPFSIGAGLISIGYVIVDNTYCKLTECCTEKEIPGDFLKLQEDLEEYVYGQHLVQQVVVPALKAHWSDSYESQKALTMSFHGWPGGGKNYVARFIQDNLFKKSSLSRHVHHFIGRIHFPLESKAEEYREAVYKWIKGNVTSCPKQLFIFDEVDKMPPTVLNSIKPVIDYSQNVEKIDYRKAIFIFLSNTGSTLITEQMVNLWEKGVTREEIQLQDFEKLISMGAFNEKGWLYREGIFASIIRYIVLFLNLGVWYQRYLEFGGFHQSDTIKSNLIDHYIPFLPMEYEHVRLCIIDEFKRRGVVAPTEDEVQKVMEYVEWGPAPHNLYSKTGCKRLSQKVGMLVHRNH